MTSEVLILNKRAVVLAADSAVTSSTPSSTDRPRYSKTATKIFELTNDGNIAIAIFASSSIDLVPWEIAIKIFRASLNTSFPSVTEYLQALIRFLSGNAKLFPQALLDNFRTDQFDSAAIDVLKQAKELDPVTFEPTATMADRQAAWSLSYTTLRGKMHGRGVAANLSAVAMDAEIADPDGMWLARVSPQISSSPELQAIDAVQLIELAHLHRYAFPKDRIGYTGVVVTGFGSDDIFPSYHLCHVHGHVGNELYWEDKKAERITHGQGSLIIPLAQRSMIDLFTDGFESSLWSIIYSSSSDILQTVFSELEAAGINVPKATSDTIGSALHDKFMQDWTAKNWKENYHPLMGVLKTLSVEEMAHLAETLLVLQSLKERVTSSTESVGGPIDVAAITKSEGMVWLKRKHYFDADQNLRYAKRLERDILRQETP